MRREKNKTNPRTGMHYVYLCHVRLSSQRVLSTTPVNDSLTLDNDSCQGLLSATREHEHDMT